MILRSILFNLLYALWTAGMHVICLPLLFASRRAVQAAGGIWIGGTLWLLKHVVGIDYRIAGAENLPKTPAIYAAKHQSAWETLFLSRYLDFPAFVLKKELLSIPLFGWFLKKSGMIAVDRKGGASALRAMARQATETLDSGRSILIFPEGTRVAPGQSRPYQPGVAALYTQQKVPLVPVALNSGLFWGRRAFIKNPGTIVVEILPPIPPGLDRKAVMKELENRIETAAKALAQAPGR
ncbi:lysophospholipid acyltransferase family protein [Dongia sedimenti]|uniref:Lysophospholipid acyltransferase family protein n=1 Tax=Dongia sedimenti TaxID=3064282 RepID=A0ABU0YIW1_9PROT|nr:lysophospholipid acyltransferase family protein [Rhodospirillaceae bacterium R-7]